MFLVEFQGNLRIDNTIVRSCLYFHLQMLRCKFLEGYRAHGTEAGVEYQELISEPTAAATMAAYNAWLDLVKRLDRDIEEEEGFVETPFGEGQSGAAGSPQAGSQVAP